MSADFLDVKEIISLLKKEANPANVEGMARFGINPDNTLGISIPFLRKLAKEINKNSELSKNPTSKHRLALNLWDTGIHEARILAVFIDVIELVDETQMEKWVSEFDSWDVCDQAIMNLFDKTPFSWNKAFEWAKRDEEFVKRAGFAMMASLAVHNKKADDKQYELFLLPIKDGSIDERNFVKKSVNWALRQIGKRSLYLNEKALEAAYEISNLDSKSAKWIARDAIKELESEKVKQKLSKSAIR